MNKIKLCIAGSRSFKGKVGRLYMQEGVKQAMRKFEFRTREIGAIISGLAPGIDSLAEERAVELGIPVIEMPAKWSDLTAPGAVIRTRWDGKQYNAKAGHDRNVEMARLADIVVIIWDGVSPGSIDMIDIVKSLGVKHHIYIPNNPF